MHLTDATASLAISRTTDPSLLLDALTHLGHAATKHTPKIAIPSHWVRAHLDDLKLGPWALLYCDAPELFIEALQTNWCAAVPHITAKSPYADEDIKLRVAQWCVVNDRLDLTSPLKDYVKKMYEGRLAAVLESSDEDASRAMQYLTAQAEMDLTSADATALFTKALELRTSAVLTAAVLGSYLSPAASTAMSAALVIPLTKYCEEAAVTSLDVLMLLPTPVVATALARIVEVKTNDLLHREPIDLQLMQLLLHYDVYPKNTQDSSRLSFSPDAARAVLQVRDSPWLAYVLRSPLDKEVFELALTVVPDPRSLFPNHVTTHERLERFLDVLETTTTYVLDEQRPGA